MSLLEKIDTSAAFRDMGFWLKYHGIAARCLNMQGDSKAAEKLFNRIVEVSIEKHPYLVDSNLVEALYYTGTFFTYQSDAKKSLYCFEKGLDFSKRVYGSDSADWTRFAAEMAYAKSRILGDHETAVQMIRNAIAVWVKKNGEFNANALRFFNLFAEIEILRGNNHAALEYNKKVLDITRRIKPADEKKAVAEFWIKSGKIYFEIDEYDLAIESYEKAIKLSQILYGKNSSLLGGLYQKLANCNYRINEYEKAIKYFQKAMQLFTFSYGEEHIKSSSMLSNIIACQTNLKQFQAAEQTAARLRKIVNFDPGLPEPFENVNITRSNLIIALYFQAKNLFFWYKENGDEQLLKEACEGFDRTVRLVENIHAGYEESGSKQYLLDRYYYVFEQALNAHYELYQCTGSEAAFARALGYTERSRAILLTETLRRSDAGYSAGLPDSLRQALKTLRRDIIRLENRRHLLQKQGKRESPEEWDINQQLYALSERRRLLEAEARIVYPAYAQAGELPPPPAPAAIQSRLQPGEAWISYFAGEDDSYAFVVRREGLRFVHIPKDFPLEQWVEELREAIYEYPLQRSDSLLQLYRERAWGLYQKLLQPFAHELPSRLIIAADGVLKYLPFEALLNAAPAECAMLDCPYLLRRHTFSYAPSATLWLTERMPAPEKIHNKVLAFAPEFPKTSPALAGAARRSSLGALVYNAEEARRIRRFFRADVVQGAAATRDRFLEQAHAYRVLHLATHAKADDENGDYSFLAFAGAQDGDTSAHGRLYARELYALPLYADLVVLSACETGIGELRRGEGIVSLAYGFAHAGARSVVTSLWRVSDRETADLMDSFYAGLRRGLPKDEALRQAKLNYLSAQKGTRAHPFFWAAFVPQGDMAPVDLPGPGPAWGWILLAAPALGIGAWRYMARQRRAAGA